MSENSSKVIQKGIVTHTPCSTAAGIYQRLVGPRKFRLMGAISLQASNLAPPPVIQASEFVGNKTI